MPRSDESDGCNHDDVKDEPNDNRCPDRAEVASTLKIRIRFLRSFRYRFKSRHEIRNDLEHQKNRNKGRVRKQRRKVSGRTARYTDADEDDKENQSSEGCPVLKRRTQTDTAIVQQGKQGSQAESDGKIRQVHGLARYRVQFQRIERGNTERRDSSD